MRILITKRAATRGNILLITLLTALVIGMSLVSYLLLVNNESRSVSRSQLWNQSLVVAEAGVEDGLAFINQYAGSDNIAAWTGTAAANNWTVSVSNPNVYYTKRYLDAAHTTYYTVYVTNNGSYSPSVRATGFVPGPKWVSGAAPLSRTVVIQAKTDMLFNAAMAAIGAIDLKGNGIATDSFDSNATNWPGYWTNTIRKPGGDVETDSTITNFTLGNANIAGRARTGPGGGYSIQANGSVGDLAWVDAGTSGIEPGWFSDDMNVTFKDPILPTITQLPAAGTGMGGSGVAPDGNPYAHVFTSLAVNNGYYSVNDNGDIYVGTNITLMIHVLPSVSTFSPNNLVVAGTGSSAAKLICYVDCPACTLGSGDYTESRIAGNMVFYGTPTCTTLNYKGNGDFTGAMYFPRADFQLAGGGNGILDFVGSSVTKTVQMNGHYHFHFDEALRKINPNNAYVAAAWVEVTQ